MKKRLSAFIEEEVFRHAKKRAAQEGRSLCALIQDALVSYLSKKSIDPRRSLSTLLREADSPQQKAVQ
jgi:hypothetical protein